MYKEPEGKSSAFLNTLRLQPAADRVQALMLAQSKNTRNGKNVHNAERALYNEWSQKSKRVAVRNDGDVVSLELTPNAAEVQNTIRTISQVKNYTMEIDQLQSGSSFLTQLNSIKEQFIQELIKDIQTHLAPFRKAYDDQIARVRTNPSLTYDKKTDQAMESLMQGIAPTFPKSLRDLHDLYYVGMKINEAEPPVSNALVRKFKKEAMSLKKYERIEDCLRARQAVEHAYLLTQASHDRLLSLTRGRELKCCEGEFSRVANNLAMYAADASMLPRVTNGMTSLMDSYRQSIDKLLEKLSSSRGTQANIRGPVQRPRVTGPVQPAVFPGRTNASIQANINELPSRSNDAITQTNMEELQTLKHVLDHQQQFSPVVVDAIIQTEASKRGLSKRALVALLTSFGAGVGAGAGAGAWYRKRQPRVPVPQKRRLSAGQTLGLLTGLGVAGAASAYGLRRYLRKPSRSHRRSKRRKSKKI